MAIVEQRHSAPAEMQAEIEELRARLARLEDREASTDTEPATDQLCNLTATGTAGSGAGALLIWAAGASEPLSSSINWSGAGQTLANGVTSACNGSQDVQIKCVASAGSSARVILDVIGYYA